MNPVARPAIILAALILIFPALGRAQPRGHGSQNRAWRLPATGLWYEGQGVFQPDADPVRGFLGNGGRIIYLANLEPGLDYTLGLRFPADQGFQPSVELFDRWPFDPAARRYKLPMGPVVRTDPDWIEYRWRLGVSLRSQGNMAFISVEAGSLSAASQGRFRHFVYLITPAVRPVNHFGTGITYLRGPQDLLLHRTTGSAPYVIEYPYEGTEMRHNRRDGWGDGDLIFNGDFQMGLQGWDMFSQNGDSAAVDHLATGMEGLRIWSDDEPSRAGVAQVVQRDVQNTASLVLGVDLRVEKDPAASGSGEAVVEVAICYRDARGGDHCGEEAYQVRFTTALPGPPAGRTVHVERGARLFFEDELMDLAPRPEVIRSVAVSGGHGPGQDAWVRQVQLTERGSVK